MIMDYIHADTKIRPIRSGKALGIAWNGDHGIFFEKPMVAKAFAQHLKGLAKALEKMNAHGKRSKVTAGSRSKSKAPPRNVYKKTRNNSGRVSRMGS